MDIKGLKRDKVKIQSLLAYHKDGTVSAIDDTIITVPAYWEEKGLFIRGDTISVIAICPIIVGNYYAVLNILSLISTDPESISIVSIEDVDYIKLFYSKGDRILSKSNVVLDDGLPYKAFDELIDRGKVPWYLTYDDMGKLMDTAADYTGLKFNIDHAIFEMVASLMTRDSNDRSKFYRHRLNVDPKTQYTFIPMSSVQYGASNTTAKLIGAYWSEGLSSALVHPSERKELIEDLLRS